MIITLLYIIFFASCILLIGTVLIQPGKSDAGALFTSSVSSTAFGPRGTQSILSRITIGAAITFMLAALMLAMPALRGDISVLQGGAGPTVTPTPAPDANPAATDANSNAAPANSEPSTGNANSGVITNTGPTGNVSTNANANR